MRQRDPERLDRLARQRAARAVGNGARQHDREADAQLLEQALDGEDRRLGIQGVENGFEEQQVHTAFEQAARRFRIRPAHVVERDGAKAGVVDIR